MERLKSSFRKSCGRHWYVIQQYEVSLSRMLNDILTLANIDFSTDQSFHQFNDLDTELDVNLIKSGSRGTIAMGTWVICQQGRLTLPDTWFRPPFWDLIVLQLLRPDFSTLSCLYSTFNLSRIPLGTFSILLWVMHRMYICKTSLKTAGGPMSPRGHM